LRIFIVKAKLLEYDPNLEVIKAETPGDNNDRGNDE
jgi:hypothetical protein